MQRIEIANGLGFTDADVVNPHDFIPAGDYNPHGVRPWVIHDAGFTVAVVFASNLQDALDEAADGGKLDAFQLDPVDSAHREDYGNGKENEAWDWNDSVAFLGNASEPFDIESLEAIELLNPPFSFAGMYAAWLASRTR